MGPWPRDTHIDNPRALTLGGCIRPKLIVWILHNVILHQTVCKAVFTQWESRCYQRCGWHGVHMPRWAQACAPNSLSQSCIVLFCTRWHGSVTYPTIRQLPWSKHSKHMFANMDLTPVGSLRNPVKQKRGVMCFQGLPFALDRSSPQHLADQNQT